MEKESHLITNADVIQQMLMDVGHLTGSLSNGQVFKNKTNCSN
jgi:hypothetical protein